MNTETEVVSKFKEAYHARIAAGLCGGCGKFPKREGRSCCESCSYAQRKHLSQLRKDAIAEYGGRCQCPGGCDVDIEAFLSIDHIRNDGVEHRKELGTGGSAIYRWLKRNNYPKDRFRLLCYNCNIARANSGGVCPHEISHESYESLLPDTGRRTYQLLNPAKGRRPATPPDSSSVRVQ